MQAPIPDSPPAHRDPLSNIFGVGTEVRFNEVIWHHNPH